MKDKDTIIHEMRIAMGKYDLLPSGHEMRTVVMEKINTLRWVLDLPAVRTQPGGDIGK
ncbi:MAG: hypothetical protein IJU89_00655 [Alphaproteobacteria bacterium]|nr:hypothetical protein [Alphaproteobacteria bacterium]